MRSKFSEMVAAGIASFQYQPILPETPETDPICISYNNIYGPALDTHMSIINGVRIITGHNIANEEKWNDFCIAEKWGGYDMNASLNSFLYNNGLCSRLGSLNGDFVCFVEECNCGEVSIATNESKVDDFYAILKKHLDAALDEGMKKKCSPSTVTDFEKAFEQYIKNEF